jgi:SpoIIAA-like
MIERLQDAPAGIVALRAVGTVTREDYEQVIEPLLDEARRHGEHLRLLLEVGPEYQGFTAGVVWEKTETVLRSFPVLRLLDGYAVVTDIGWLREAVQLVGFLLPFPLRVFSSRERDEAVAWLSSLTERAA